MDWMSQKHRSDLRIFLIDFPVRQNSTGRQFSYLFGIALDANQIVLLQISNRTYVKLLIIAQ